MRRPPTSPVERSNVVAASAPIPRSVKPIRNAAAAATEINTVVAKGSQDRGSVISTSNRLSAAKGNEVWMRAVMLAPSASNAMSTTVLGDTDMTLMRSYFVKPPAAIAMGFSDDPMMGMTTDRFSGSATAKLTTKSKFVLRTAACALGSLSPQTRRCLAKASTHSHRCVLPELAAAPAFFNLDIGCYGGPGSRFACPGRREDSSRRLNASEHPERLHIGFQNGFLLGALIGVLLAHSNDGAQRLGVVAGCPWASA